MFGPQVIGDVPGHCMPGGLAAGIGTHVLGRGQPSGPVPPGLIILLGPQITGHIPGHIVPLGPGVDEAHIGGIRQPSGPVPYPMHIISFGPQVTEH
jgi:hypothetical protein